MGPRMGWTRAPQQRHRASVDIPLRVEALQGEWVVAVSIGHLHTFAIMRGGSVFGWGHVAALGLQGIAPRSEDLDGVDCLLSPRRYSQLSCVP